MENNDNYIKDILFLADSIAKRTINRSSDYSHFDFKEDIKDTYKEILEFSKEVITDMYKKNNKVCLEDIVTISINNDKPEVYFITGRNSYSNEYKSSFYVYDDKGSNTVIDPEQVLCVIEGTFGYELLERYEGEEFECSMGEEKNVCNVKVLSIRKTKYSYPLSKAEVEAAINYKGKKTK